MTTCATIISVLGRLADDKIAVRVVSVYDKVMRGIRVVVTVNDKPIEAIIDSMGQILWIIDRNTLQVKPKLQTVDGLMYGAEGVFVLRSPEFKDIDLNKIANEIVFADKVMSPELAEAIKTYNLTDVE